MTIKKFLFYINYVGVKNSSNTYTDTVAFNLLENLGQPFYFVNLTLH